MFGKKVSGQTTQKLFMTPAVSSAVAPSARNFQEVQQVRGGGTTTRCDSARSCPARAAAYTACSLSLKMGWL
jgi:hypothetical protein